MYIIYANNTLRLALAVHEISRHFWAAYDITNIILTSTNVSPHPPTHSDIYNDYSSINFPDVFNHLHVLR